MFEACDQQQQQGQVYKGQVRRLHRCAEQWKCIAHQCQVAQSQRVTSVPQVLPQLLLKVLLLQRFQALQAIAEHEEAKDRSIDVRRVDEVLVRDRVVLAEEAWLGRAAAMYYICKGHTLWHTVPCNSFVSGDTCLPVSIRNPQAVTASPYPVCQKRAHTATSVVCCVL